MAPKKSRPVPSFSPLKRSRLARHDIVAAATKIDELDYALEGMGTRVLTVMRSSVLEVAGMLTDAKARLSLFRTHGVLARVVGGAGPAGGSGAGYVYGTEWCARRAEGGARWARGSPRGRVHKSSTKKHGRKIRR